MKVALLQPQFAPNLYDLAAMLKADLVVWNDLEQWHRKGRTHRAAIKGDNGQQWINIPVKTEDRKKPIREVRIEQNEEWIEPFWNALHHSYSEATWYDFFADELEADISKFSEFKLLSELNTWFFGRLMKYLEFGVDYKLASQLPDFDPNPDVFTQQVGADVLYQEHDSRHYQWRSDEAIEAQPKHPEYSQLGNDFIPELSLFDLLFNEGKESFRVFEKLVRE
ncbi:WbqC family protein [Gracilimonas mengyeensis]|uniref:WbqC-like protein family protein n=1 Tax=Gracilimonas mengyeensis TaxID=1302730 RepID=A0A521F937_9BACT|nr:WbqC family protein [Gracilimonas mengyeensis]SMO92729.1 WbqC-like protein family protein [Gracilimonas mengyeensis]